MKSPLAARFSFRRSRTITPATRALSAAVLLTGGLGLGTAHAQSIAGSGYKGTVNNGTANTGNWSDAGNWDALSPSAGERNLFFGQGYKAAGGTNFISNNDLVGYAGYRITFQDSNAAGTSTDGSSANDTAFTITGNGFTLFDFGSGNFPRIQNDSFLTQTFSLSSGQTIVLSGGVNNKAEINAVNADLVFSANTAVDLAGTTQLQINSVNGKNLTFNGVISSSGNSGANSVAINGNNNVIYAAANTYSGGTFVNAGKLQFNTGGSADNSQIYIGDTAATAVNAEVDLLPLTGGLSLSSIFNPRAGNTGTATIDSRNTSGTNTLSGHIALDKALTITESGAIGTGVLAITQARAGGVGTLTGTDIKGFALTLNVTNLGNAINFSGDIYNSTGSGTVTKTGFGLLTLSGTNTYTGTTTVSGGVLRLAGGNAIADAGVIANIASGALLDLNGSSETIASITAAPGSISLGAGTLTLASNNASSVTGLVYGTTTGGALVKQGTGLFTLGTVQNSPNSFASGNLFGGGITVSGGTLTINTANASGTGLITANSTLNISQPQFLLTGGITINAGTTTLSAANAGGSGGTVTLNTGGTLAVTSANALQLNSVNLAGGTATLNTVVSGTTPNFVASASIGALSGSVNLGGLPAGLNTSASVFTLTLGANNASPAAAYTGALVNPPSGVTSLIKVGSGTQILNGTSTNSGIITANGSGGTLEIGGQFTAITSAVNNAGTLRLNFNAASAPSTNLLNPAATLKMNGGTLAVVGKDATGGISQTFASTDFGSASIYGAGTISVTNGTSGSATALNLGALTRFSGNGINFVLPSGSQTAANGILTTTGTAGALLRDGSNRAYATVNGTDFAAKDATTNNIVALPTYFTATSSSVGTTTSDNADIAGGVNPTIAASATTNTLRFSGPTASTLTVNSGQILTLNSGGILVSSAVTGAGSRITGAGSITSATGTAEIVLHQFSAQPFTLDAAITNANAGATATTFTKTGPGTLIVTKGSTNSGPTYVDSGVLQIGAGGSFQNSVVTLAISDPTAVFNVNNQTTSVSNIDGGGGTGGYINLGTSGTLNIIGGNSSQYKGALVGGVDSAVNKSGSGSQGFNGANNNAFYGTLTIASGNTIGSFSGSSSGFTNANVVNNGTYNVGSGPGVQISFGSLAGTGTIQGAQNASSNQTYGLGYLNRDTNFAGVITNGTNATPGLTLISKFGSGTTTFSGNNTYTGTTQINTGGLLFDYSGGKTPLTSGTTGSPLTVGGGTATFKAPATGATTIATGPFGVNNSAFSRVVVDSNGGTGTTLTLQTTTNTLLPTLGSTTQSNVLLFDLSSSASNVLQTSAVIGAAVAGDTAAVAPTAIRTNNGLLATGTGNGTTLVTYRADVLIRDSTGYGFATNTANGSGTGANTTIISRYTGAMALTAADTTTALSDNTNYKISNTSLTRADFNTFNYNTLELNSSTAAASLTTDSTGNRFGANSQTTSGRGVLATGTFGATITSLGGTNQTTYFNNYLTGSTLAGQTFTLNMPLLGATFFNGLSTNLTVASGLVANSDQYFQSGVTRLTGAQNSGDALLAGTGVYRLTGGILEIGADLTGTVSASSGADFSRTLGVQAGQVQLVGDTGFSAYTGTVNGVRTVNLGGAGQQVAWGVDNFVVSTAGGDGNNTLRFSSAFADSTLDFQNAIALGNTTRNVDVTNGAAAVDARLSGVLSGVLTTTATLANGAPATLNAAAGLTKLGAGTLELTAVNTYRGQTTVTAGTLLVTGGVANVDPALATSGTGTGAVVVNNSGSLLGGTGNISGAVTVNALATITGGTQGAGGVIAAGNVGTLSTGSLTLASTSLFAADIASVSSYDILNVNGTVTLAGNLAINIPTGLTITPGTRFTLIANDGLDPISGTFSGYAQGATLSAGGNNFTVDYLGGTGNDFDLVAVPEPGTVAAGLLALGSLGLSQRRRVRRFLTAKRQVAKAA